MPALITLIEKYKFNVNHATKNKETALMIAANDGHLPIIKYLISKGAKVNATDSLGFSPLLYAVKQGKFFEFIYLLSKGADINVKDE